MTYQPRPAANHHRPLPAFRALAGGARSVRGSATGRWRTRAGRVFHPTLPLRGSDDRPPPGVQTCCPGSGLTLTYRPAR